MSEAPEPFSRKLGRARSMKQKLRVLHIVWAMHSDILKTQAAKALGMTPWHYLEFLQDAMVATWTGQPLYCPKCPGEMLNHECVSCGFSPGQLLKVADVAQGYAHNIPRPDLQPIDPVWSWDRSVPSKDS